MFSVHLMYCVNTVCLVFSVAFYCILSVLYLEMDTVQAKKVLILKSEILKKSYFGLPFLGKDFFYTH